MKWTSPCRRVTLYKGDALEILPRLEPFAALVTDPPYSSGGMVRGDRMQATRAKYQSTDAKQIEALFSGDNRDQRAWFAWSALWLSHCLRIAEPGAIAAVFTDWRQLPTATDAIQSDGWVWRGIVPWDKINARPMPNRYTSQCEYVVWGTNGPRDFATQGATYHAGILRSMPPATKDRRHSTQKPVQILRDLVEVAKPGKTILDPFVGSGSTGVACLETGRRFVGIEVNGQYFEIALERIKAELRGSPTPAASSLIQ